MAGNRYPRTARVNELVREVLGDELERMEDPRLGLTTITGVQVSGDLRHADVFYSVLGNEEQHEKTAAALESAKKHLRASLGRQVTMKYLPELHFKEDPAIASGQRVEQIIREIHERDAAAGIGGDATGVEDAS
jgi:ribosome-binding factor A